MGWNNFALDETLDWSAQSFLNMFCEAYNERLTTAGSFGWARPDPGASGTWTTPIAMSFDGSTVVGTLNPPMNVTVGDDVQGASSSTGGFLWKLQYYTFILSGYFAKLSLLDSSGAHAGPWTTSNTMDVNGTTSATNYADIPYQICYPEFYDLPTTFTIAGIPAGHFRRRKPREVRNVGALISDDDSYATADTIDTEGNLLASGMVAWLLTVTSAYPYALGDDGRWHQTKTLSPDVLDSNTPAPAHVPIGFIQPGDYVGWWLFAELRTFLNAMVRIPCNVTFKGVSFKTCHYTAGGTDLAANWAAASTVSVSRTSLSSNVANLVVEQGTTNAYAVGSSYGFSTESLLYGGSTPIGIPLPTGLAKVVEFWATGTTQFEAVAGGFNPLHVPPDTGDPQGASQILVMEQYQLVESITLGSTDTNVDGSVVWGDLSFVPNQCPVHPAGYGQDTCNGNSAIPIGIVRFDVAGGYRYSANS